MMQHYLQTKEEYKDCILFYRLGDFYEMFFDDAVLVSKELELTLTGKSCGMEERAPMCGIPYHAVEGYLNRLVDNTHNVIVFGFIQCLDIHICSGRYNTDDLSFYNSFCKLWIFHLLTDCHFMSIGYQTV